MGLDSYFKKPTEDNKEYQEITVEFEGRQPNLIGGLFSGTGQDGSFRGKCYDGVIEALTESSLYVEQMDNSEVLTITESLRKALYEEQSEEYSALRDWFKSGDNYYDLDLEDIEDLYRVFDAFGKEGCDLFGWW